MDYLVIIIVAVVVLLAAGIGLVVYLRGRPAAEEEGPLPQRLLHRRARLLARARQALALRAQELRHVAVRLRTSAGDAVFSGDLMHRTVQVAEPQWSSRFCDDPARARDTRRAFVEVHADSGVLILAAHFPTEGFIVRGDGGYRFVPAA